MTLELTQFSSDPAKLNKTLSEFPSVSWFTAASVEGFQSFQEAAESGRIKPASYLEHDDENLTCWRCDGSISHKMNAGRAAKYKAGAKFNDHWECKGKHNETPVICAACDLLADRVYHPNFKLNALYTGSEAYQLTLDEDLISFFFNPPPPPYLFVMGENNSQHMAWLSDYTLDSDLISIQKSRDRFLVSRKHALKIARKYSHILKSANHIRESLGHKVNLATPLESTRREINNRTGNNMQLSQSVYVSAQIKETDSVEIAELKKTLQTDISLLEAMPMTYGDWYVASMLLKAFLTDFVIKPSTDWQVIAKKTK